MTRLSHHEIEDLLAAYALDAVADDELDAIEMHLRDCPRCRGAVADYREAVSCLAAGDDRAPVEVWDSIAAEISPVEPSGRMLPELRPRRRYDWRLAVVGAAAAVLLVAALVTQVASQGDRLRELQAVLSDRTVIAAALAAEADPNARRAELRTATGTVAANAVLAPDGTGFLRTNGLRPLPPDRSYQLWAVVGTERISAGVLGTNPDVVAFRVAGDVLGLAVTEEATGGVVASRNQPVASGLVLGT